MFTQDNCKNCGVILPTKRYKILKSETFGIYIPARENAKGLVCSAKCGNQYLKDRGWAGRIEEV